MSQEAVQGDIYRVVYNTNDGQRKNILVLAVEQEDANTYVKKLERCSNIAIPAMKVASNVHIDPAFFEEFDLVDELSIEERDDQHDDNE